MQQQNTLDHYSCNQQILEAIEKSLSLHPANEYSGTSELWKKIFDRRMADRSFDSFFRMLDHKNDLTLGIANLSEERFFSDYIRLYTNVLSKEDIERIAPGLTGCPSLLQVHGIPTNIAVMQNETRVKQLLGHIGIPSQPLRVLEIGAGFGGMANLLIKRGIVSSYTIVDLPDNLAQSAYFLTLENPSYQAHYCEAKEHIDNNHLNFFTPNEINKLNQSKYDLIINCDSLGEMPANVARKYVSFIFERLSPTGTFYSKNGVMRNTNTVVKLSDYGFERFHLSAVMATPLSTGLFDDHSTVLFLRNTPPSQKIEWKHLDILSQLYKFGLNKEIESCAMQFANPPLEDNCRYFLDTVARFFSANGDHWYGNAKIDFKNTHLNAAFTYLLGMYESVFHSQKRGRKLLMSYLEQTESALAEGQARILLSRFNKKLLQNEELENEVTRFFIRTIKLPIMNDESAHSKYLTAAEKRIKNRFLSLLPK